MSRKIICTVILPFPFHINAQVDKTRDTDTPLFDDNGESKISVEDLAVALLDELENGDFIQQRFTVAY